MNIKHFLIKTVFFTTIFLSVFYVKSQNSSEAITVVRKGLGYAYYQNDKMLNINQIANITRENADVHKYLVKSDVWWITGICFGIAGGGCIGYSLGYALGCTIAGNSIEMKKVLPSFLVGAGLSCCSIIFEVVSKDN